MSRTVKDTTLDELLKTVAPVRAGTTGAHVVGAGKDCYLVVVQGPEARELSQHLLNCLQALYDIAEEKRGVGA